MDTTEKASLKDVLWILRDEARKCRGGSRRYGWMESAIRSIEELCKGGFGKALNAEKGMKLEEILSVPVVFELEGLGDDQRRFFCLYFLQAVFLYRKASSDKREVLKHILVFDESQNIFLREKYGGMLELPSRLAREIREYGESVIAASQQSDVSESLIANAGFKFVLRCDYPSDVLFASRLMNMDTKWFPKIPMGYCVARLPVRHLTPFLFRFDPQKVKEQNVPDSEVRERWEKHGLRIIEEAVVELSEDEFTLLLDVVDHPISTITERYKRLGWNFKKGNNVKDCLLVEEVARFKGIKTPDGWVKILYLTRKGREVLKDKGIDVNRVIYGGPEHEYWKHVLKKKLEKMGFTVKEEYPIKGGKRVDLYAVKGKNVYFVEVETGHSDILENVRKCSGLKGKMVLFFTSAEVKKEHQELGKKGVVCLDSSDLHRIHEFLQ